MPDRIPRQTRLQTSVQVNNCPIDALILIVVGPKPTHPLEAMVKGYNVCHI